ncbi:MAG: class I SAM-dependent rRNA methyltransferase, partial [Planctomycetaceae bacterium]|nr:class I SAM-dependent rRNA methyltransferase [Planctomycetaceae bacterium]
MSASEFPTVVLQKRRALPFFSHHPWVFAGAIDRIDGDAQPGDEVIVRSDKGEFIGRGLYNPASQIRVRLYGWDESRSLDPNFWTERIDQALALRERLFGDSDARRACRLIFSEGDHLSGLTVDRYGDWLLV